MKCQNCGAPLQGTETYCYDCGQEVKKETISNPTEQVSEFTAEPVVKPVSEQPVEEMQPMVNNDAIVEPVKESVVETTTLETTKKKNKTLVVVGIIVLIIILLFGAFIVFKDYFM